MTEALNLRVRHAGLAAIALLVCASGPILIACSEAPPPPEPVPQWQDAALSRGLLRVFQLGTSAAPGESVPLSAAFRNDAHYSGHEDNDLRGNLDGTFKWGWNQPGQAHVRVGRRGMRPSYGELELFRVTHRFADLDLPRDAEVHAAHLELQIESGAQVPVRVMLYPLHGDFDPGQGGTLRDNASPPKPGEVWWNHRAWPDAPWGLPGANAVGPAGSGADTPPEPVAEARFEPGDEALHFESPALARYVEQRLHSGDPVNFLLKLADRHEDFPGTVMEVYAANEGEARAPARRPRLGLQWSSPRALPLLERELRLERGRSLVERLPLGSGPVVIDFAARPGSGPLTIEVRGGNASSVSPWRQVPAGRPIDTQDWSWLELRLAAVRDPVVLGSEFSTGFRETWIRNGPPEEQRVEFHFRAPSGIEHVTFADYVGDFRWQIGFRPDEIGTWSYVFTKQFARTPYFSTRADFDVVGGDLNNVLARLVALREAFEALPVARRGPSAARFSLQLMSLERAGIQSLAPGGLDEPDGKALHAELRRLRETIDGNPMPDVLPLEPNQPPRWQLEAKAP